MNGGQFNHHDLYPHLRASVDKVTSMRARVGTCGECKTIIQWPEGKSLGAPLPPGAIPAATFTGGTQEPGIDNGGE